MQGKITGHNSCYKTHAVSHLFNFSMVSLSTALFKVCVHLCLWFQGGSSTAGNTWSRYRSHDYSQISLIPFPDTSLLSPGGDIDKGRNRADQDSTTAFDFQQVSFTVSWEGSRHRTSLYSSVPWRGQSQQWHKLGTDRQDVQNWTFLTLQLSSYNGDKLVPTLSF